jgi:hypothetical protein
MKPKAYLETTIVSYLTARPSRDLITAAHQQVTQQWWQTRRAHFDLFVAPLVIQEAQAGDPEAAARRLAPLHDIPLLGLSEEATRLAQALVAPGPLPANAVVHALHIAIAAVNECTTCSPGTAPISRTRPFAATLKTCAGRKAMSPR